MNDSNEIIEINNEDNIKPLENNNDSAIKTIEPKRNKNTKKVLRIVLIVAFSLIAILLVVLLVIYLMPKKEEEKPNESIVIEKDNYRYENGKLIFLDKSNREIGNYTCKSEGIDKCYVAKNAILEDNFERVKSIRDNKEIEKNSQIYLDRYVFIIDNDEEFLFDIKDNDSLLSTKLFKAYNTEKNYVVIKNEIDKYGLIEITEDGFDYLIRPSYDYLGMINLKLNYLLAKDKDKTTIIDSTGKELSKNIQADVQSVNEKFVVGIKNNDYYLFTLQFEELLNDYDYIGLHNDIISLVKNNRLYLVDSNLNKLNEDGIRLENKNYVKEYIYDDNKLIETKKSYEVISKDDGLYEITVGDSSKIINSYEGLASSNYDYFSYFDGKLYFYSEIEKLEVIGTYTCNNKNTINIVTNILDNCVIYSNNDLYSGIYNNDYVFIYDNNSNEDIKYYLYSLKEKKVKGTYSEINIINNEEMNNVVKSIYTGNSYIIAKNATGINKDKYGVLQITSDKVTSKIGFKNKSIIHENQYYLFITNDGIYSLYDESFDKISDDFDFIKLYDNYYAGIKNNKLNIYTYTNKSGVIENDISISGNEFAIDFSDGFKITINDDIYEYDKSGKIKIKEIEENTEVEESEENNEE